MPIVKTIAIVIGVLIVLWLFFAIVGILSAILRSLLVVVIVVLIVYGLYHFFTHREA
jgi:uncharacterized membrane protein